MFENPDEIKAKAKECSRTLWGGLCWLWSQVPPLHPAGWPFVALFAVAALVLTMLWDGFLPLGIVLTLWCAFFFRNPPRVTPTQDGVLVAPADGKISMIRTVTLPSEFDEDDNGALYTRISIFLNVFDVHVQRVPCSGMVREVVYRPGKFLNASLDKASEDNERSSVLLETAEGDKVAFVQIAGLIARRIINTLKKDQTVTRGELYGLIRFGSRVDVYVPASMTVLASVGQRTVGGETVLASRNSQSL